MATPEAGDTIDAEQQRRAACRAVEDAAKAIRYALDGLGMDHVQRAFHATPETGEAWDLVNFYLDCTVDAMKALLDRVSKHSPAPSPSTVAAPA